MNCKFADWELRRNFTEGVRCGNSVDVLEGKPTGVVRVSLGAMSSLEDITRLVQFLEEMFLETKCSEPIIHPIPLAEKPPKLHIQSLQLFPVVGCCSWQIPQNCNWPVKDRGLAWDREWYIVDQHTNCPLDPARYHQMKTISPSLDVEKGTLKLTVSCDAPKVVRVPSDVTLSIWGDLPPRFASDDLEIHSSESVVAFLTTVLGVPCTLARTPRRGTVAGMTGVGFDSS